ncbi:MAG: Chromosomal replication initiator protein DnaA, partial [uncultured Nocardioidaceae bacterium]
VRARGLALRRRAAGDEVQPALYLGRRRPRQDPPAPRDRPPLPGPRPPALYRLCLFGDLHERHDQLAADAADGGLPGALPEDRRPDDRRHPVHRRQGEHPGGVLPHLQRPPPERQAGHHLLRQAAQGHRRDRGAPPLPLRGRPDRRRPAPRLRDADRHPPGQGRGAARLAAARRRRVRRPARPEQHPRAGGRPQQDPGVRGADRADDVAPAGDGGADRRPLRPAGRDHARRDPGDRGRPVPGQGRGPPGSKTDQGGRQPAPDRDVPGPRADAGLAGRDRRGPRRARPHHRHARHRQGRPRPGDRRRAAGAGRLAAGDAAGRRPALV